VALLRKETHSLRHQMHLRHPVPTISHSKYVVYVYTHTYIHKYIHMYVCTCVQLTSDKRVAATQELALKVGSVRMYTHTYTHKYINIYICTHVHLASDK